MEVLEGIPEGVVDQAFLLAELDSERYGASVRLRLAQDGRDPDAITRANPEDPAVCAYLHKVLVDIAAHMGPVNPFHGLPADLTWHRARMRGAEAAALKYIRIGTWETLFAPERLVRDGAAHVQRGGSIDNVTPELVERVAEVIVTRGMPQPPLVVGSRIAGPFVIVDGHLRLTACALAAARDAAVRDVKLDVLAGLSPRVADWPCF